MKPSKPSIMKPSYAALFISFFSILNIQTLHAQDHATGQNDMHAAKEHIMLNEKDLVWKAGPASLPAGAKMIVMEGDLSKAGPFTIRLQLPSNYRVGPHFHPAIEHVTVVDGIFFMGTGKEYNVAAATPIKKAGFAVMPVGYAHYAYTKSKTVIQLHGMGPWGITYVNDADDPRKSK